MSVCESVSIIAKELEEQLGELSSAKQSRLNTLKVMPTYLKKMRLDLFDKDFTGTYIDGEDKGSKTYKAIEILAGLAFENMYVAFSLDDTMRTYKWVIEELGKINITISTNLDMSEL